MAAESRKAIYAAIAANLAITAIKFTGLFEGYSFTIAFKAFQSERGKRTIWSQSTPAKIPPLTPVLFEDSAALLGLIVAFAGVFFAHTLDHPYFDGAASVLIGIILAVVAVLPAESKGLLVGESADPER